MIVSNRHIIPIELYRASKMRRGDLLAFELDKLLATVPTAKYIELRVTDPDGTNGDDDDIDPPF